MGDAGLLGDLVAVSIGYLAADRTCELCACGKVERKLAFFCDKDLSGQFRVGYVEDRDVVVAAPSIRAD